MYKEITNELKTRLEAITKIKDVIPYPTTKGFKAFPTAIYFPSGNTSNVFSTSSDNFREYNYKLFILIGVDNTTLKNVFEAVLPNTCDAIFEEFDKKWSLNSINGKRAWVRAESVSWGIDTSDKGLMAVAEYNIIIKLSVPN